MRKPRPAFTLIELLVVMAVISVLVGLLLPAVQKVRGTANRMKSLNNLKQQALAVHSFHDAHERLPSDRFPLPPPTTHWQILPYLEQGNLVAIGDADPSDPAYLHARVPILLDPTDPSTARSDLDLKCSYAFNAQITGLVPAFNHWADERSTPTLAGPYHPPEIPGVGTLVGIGDGTSNTILITQRFANCQGVSVSGIPCFFGKYASPPTRAVYAPEWLPQVGIRPGQCVGGVAQTTLSSILVALCDGSVRAIPGDAAKANWWAAGTPNGGEVPANW
jgi:prepilin-type N-terminal cleavage/methylation domain-containing protein